MGKGEKYWNTHYRYGLLVYLGYDILFAVRHQRDTWQALPQFVRQIIEEKL